MLGRKTKLQLFKKEHLTYTTNVLYIFTQIMQGAEKNRQNFSTKKCFRNKCIQKVSKYKRCSHNFTYLNETELVLVKLAFADQRSVKFKCPFGVIVWTKMITLNSIRKCL